MQKFIKIQQGVIKLTAERKKWYNFILTRVLANCSGIVSMLSSN